MSSQIEPPRITVTTAPIHEINTRNCLITENSESAPDCAPVAERVMGEFHLLELKRLFGPPIPRDIDHLPKEVEIIKKYGSDRDRIEPYRMIPIFLALEKFNVTSVNDYNNPLLMVPNCATCCDRYQICEIHERITENTSYNTKEYMHALRAIYLLVFNAYSLPCFSKFRKACLPDTRYGFEKCCDRRICHIHTPNLAILWDEILYVLNKSKEISLGKSGRRHICAHTKGTCAVCRDSPEVNKFIGVVYDAVKELITKYRYINCVFEPGCNVPFKLNIKAPERKLNPRAPEFKPSK